MISSDPVQIVIETIFTVFEATAFVLSVFGNLLVIYVMAKKKKLKKKSNYYIISVAVADLLTGLVGIPSCLYAVS